MKTSKKLKLSLPIAAIIIPAILFTPKAISGDVPRIFINMKATIGKIMS